MTPADAGLLGVAAEAGVVIEYEPMGDDGRYYHRRRLIRLRTGMHARLHRSVLAHELAHAVAGDSPTPFGPIHDRQERRAEAWAALYLIDPDAYRAAEEVCDGHAGAMAVELGVMRSIVAAYRDLLLRAGEHVYLAPRMGAGQWVARRDVAW